MNNYGCGEVNIIGQLPVSLKLGDKECHATILVQKGAALDLLLGTDLLTQLRFCILKAPNREGQMIDLLQGDAWKGKILTTSMKMPDAVPVTATGENSTGEAGASEKPTGREGVPVHLEEKNKNINLLGLSGGTALTLEQSGQGNTAEVRLLKAVRLPGRHYKIVTGSTVTLESKELLLDPNLRNPGDNRVIVTEALVKVDQQNKVKVLVENHETFPMFLEARTTLGFLQPMQVVSPDILSEVLHLEADTLDKGTGSKTTTQEQLHRAQQLMDQIDIEWKNISGAEATELKSVLDEFNEVFAYGGESHRFSTTQY